MAVSFSIQCDVSHFVSM